MQLDIISSRLELCLKEYLLLVSSFLHHFPTPCLTSVSWNHCPEKLLALEFLSKGWFLGEPMKHTHINQNWASHLEGLVAHQGAKHTHAGNTAYNFWTAILGLRLKVSIEGTSLS